MILIAALVLALAGCQPGSNPRPVPSVPQIGGDLKCSTGDHAYKDPQLGWGFCYPSTWKYIERSQALDDPKGIDLTFDFTCLSSCKMSSPDATCASSPSQPQCTPGNNLFGYMIVSTYERGASGDLAGWAATNIKPSPKLDSISWGDAVEADKMADGRLIALTPHFVVILDVRSGPLDLEGEMASRLGTWKFSL